MSRRGISPECESFEQSEGWFRRCVLNRVKTITTTNALLWGVAWLIISAMLGWYFRIMPTSACSFTLTDYVPLRLSLLLHLIVWITWTAPFLLIALLRNVKVSINELFSRMLFAHWPVIIVMLPGILGYRVAFATYLGNPIVAFDLYPAFSTILTIVLLLVVGWWLRWSYQAYSVSTGRNIVVDKILFVVVAILAGGLSEVVLDYVLESVLA